MSQKANGEEILMKVRESRVSNASNLKVFFIFFYICFETVLLGNYVIFGFPALVMMI